MGHSAKEFMPAASLPMRQSLGPPIMLFVIGVALTLLLFMLARDAERISLQRQLNRWATGHAAAVQMAVNKSVQTVNTVRLFYRASREVDGEEFEAFVGPILADQPYFQALEWAPRVLHAERTAFEAIVRAEGHAEFRIIEQPVGGTIQTAASRAEYYPIRRVAPLVGNEVVLGFDIASRSLWAPMLAAARDIGRAQVSEVFRPVQGRSNQSASIILLAVYRQAVPLETTAQRRAALAGYVVGLVHIDALVETALRGRPVAGLDLELTDETLPNAPVRMLRHASRLRTAAAAPDPQRMQTLVALDVPGRRWVLHFASTPEFVAEYAGKLPGIVLATGLAFSLLFSVYLFQVLRRNARINLLASDLTQSTRLLQATGERLTNLITAAPIAVIAVDREMRTTEWNPHAERMFGWGRDEVLGQPLPHIDLVTTGLHAAVQAGKPNSNIEGVRRRKDGSDLYVRGTWAPLRDAAGQLAGMMAVLQDISDVHRAQEAVRQRDAMLKVIYETSQLLLQSEHWSAVMPEVLRGLGEAAAVDRVYLCANHHTEDGTLLTSQLHEWCADDIFQVAGRPEARAIRYADQGLGRWVALMAAGDVIQGDVEDFPARERPLLEALGVCSALMVPVSLGDAWWGYLGFNSCRARREWGTEMVRLLRIAAKGLGATLRRQQYEEQLRQSALVFSNTVDSVMITDAADRILDVNPAFTEITGYSREEAIGRKPNLIHSELHDPDFYRALWAVLRRDGLWRGEIWDRRKNGETFPARLTISAVKGPTGQPSHYVGVLTDLTAIRDTQARLEYLALHDPLTDLSNRRMYAMQLEQATQRAARGKSQLAILVIDIDRFKDINDSLGHPAGDQLLLQFAQRLQGSMRDAGTVARHGGDEFLVLLEPLRDMEAAAAAAQALLDVLAQPFIVEGHALLIKASIGISLYPQDGEDVETLLRNADTAMYRAKELGRGRYDFYTEDLTNRAYERMLLVSQLAGALEMGQLQLYYQPQVDLQTGQIIGAEALLRWLHPEHGMISPARFIPLAEESGLIVPIGEWVLRTACATARHWCEGNSGFRRIAVNVAGQQVTSEFAQTVRAVLEQTGLRPACLELEVTEGFIIGHADDAIARLNDLKSLGLELAIDDFGTGYSSLSYLKRLPIDKLKIDQSFVRGMPNPDDEAITRAVIALSKSLGLQVIAEGVETELQRDFLKAEGCHEGQGYLYSKPVPADALAALLERRL